MLKNARDGNFQIMRFWVRSADYNHPQTWLDTLRSSETTQEHEPVGPRPSFDDAPEVARPRARPIREEGMRALPSRPSGSRSTACRACRSTSTRNRRSLKPWVKGHLGHARQHSSAAQDCWIDPDWERFARECAGVRAAGDRRRQGGIGLTDGAPLSGYVPKRLLGIISDPPRHRDGGVRPRAPRAGRPVRSRAGGARRDGAARSRRSTITLADPVLGANTGTGSWRSSRHGDLGPCVQVPGPHASARSSRLQPARVDGARRARRSSSPWSSACRSA